MTMLLAALASAAYLTWGRLQFGPALIATAVLGLELALRQGWLRFSLGSLPLYTIFAITVAVCGFLLFQGESAKLRVAAATVVLMVGAFQTLAAFNLSS